MSGRMDSVSSHEPRENRMKSKTETEEKVQKKTPYEPPAFEKRERLDEVVESTGSIISGQIIPPP